MAFPKKNSIWGRFPSPPPNFPPQSCIVIVVSLSLTHAVVLNAVGRKCAQKSANESKRKSAQERKRAQKDAKGAKERKRELPRIHGKQARSETTRFGLSFLGVLKHACYLRYPLTRKDCESNSLRIIFAIFKQYYIVHSSAAAFWGFSRGGFPENACIGGAISERNCCEIRRRKSPQNTEKQQKKSSAQRFLNDPFPKTPFFSC